MLYAVIVTRKPLFSTELHVFHYPTHSTVYVIATTDDGACHLPAISHEHTRDGGEILRACLPFLTRTEAEEYVTGIEDDAANTSAISPVTVFRHDTTAAPAPARYAVKIEADNDDAGNPRRGWMLYEAHGRYAGFVTEGYQGLAALNDAGNVIKLATVKTSPAYYRQVISATD